MSDPTALREKLRAELSCVSWKQLLPHHIRGALVRVNPQIDLVEAAAAVAEDQAAIVKAWMGAELMGTASDEEIRAWADEGQVFEFLIVQPFVLARPVDGSVEEHDAQALAALEAGQAVGEA